MEQAKPPIVTQVQSPEEWLEAIPQMRLLTIEGGQYEQDLHRKSTEVQIFGAELEQFCMALIEHMHENHGIGLAAPQMGVFQRIFVSQIDEEEAPKILINPQITVVNNNKELSEEGCLSVPGVYADIERWPSIDITAQDLHGEHFTLCCTGLDAICFQHENDHLEGILFTDYLSPSQLRKIKKHLAE